MRARGFYYLETFHNPRRPHSGSRTDRTGDVRGTAHSHHCGQNVRPPKPGSTAYYVVNEAVTNVVKHADARRIGLRVVQDDAALHVRVEDDGRGRACVRPGSGLAGLADRVAAAGGSLLVHSPAGRGTIIEAVLPCAS